MMIMVMMEIVMIAVAIVFIMLAQVIRRAHTVASWYTCMMHVNHGDDAADCAIVLILLVELETYCGRLAGLDEQKILVTRSWKLNSFSFQVHVNLPIDNQYFRSGI